MKKVYVIFLGCFITLIVSGIPLGLVASDFPTRPIEVISPNAPGGGMDFVLTLFKGPVEKVLKQPIIISYKTGAAGMIGTMHVKGLKPDGYSLLAASISTFILPPLTRKTADYTLDDFTPICNLTTVAITFCVKDDSPYKTMRDFIEAAKTKKMRYATAGVFSIPQIAFESLGKMAGFQAIHIPYKGAAAAMNAVIGGHADIAMAGTTAFVGPGRLRLLAVISEKRLENYPDVPTLRELGYSLSNEVPYSLWGPKGIPEEIVSKLYEAFKKAFEQNSEEITRIARGQEHTIFLLDSKALRKNYQEQHNFYKKFLAEFKEFK